MVARPPHLRVPNRRKGTERVVIPGATSRITMTFSGSAGISLLDDIAVEGWWGEVSQLISINQRWIGRGLVC